MDFEKIEKFYNELMDSKRTIEDLKVKLLNIQDELEYKKFIEDEILPIAREKGYKFDVDDILSYDKNKMKNLSEDELENIVGGKMNILATSMFSALVIMFGISAHSASAMQNDVNMSEPTYTYVMQTQDDVTNESEYRDQQDLFEKTDVEDSSKENRDDIESQPSEVEDSQGELNTSDVESVEESDVAHTDSQSVEEVSSSGDERSPFEFLSDDMVYVNGEEKWLMFYENTDSSKEICCRDKDCNLLQSCKFDVSENFNAKEILNDAAEKLVELGDTFSLKYFVSSYPDPGLKILSDEGDQGSSIQYDSVEVTSKESFDLDGIKYQIESDDKVSMIAIDKTLETVNIEKYVTYNESRYEVVAINPSDYYVLSDSNVKVMNLPEEGISIENCTFSEARQLTTVKNFDKANIGTLCDSFFVNCINLSEISLPESLETVGVKMFSNCQNLRIVNIGKNVEKIGEEGFLDCCNLEAVNFAEGSVLNKIEKGAFCGCEKLKACKISGSIREIDDYAFVGCKSLDHITLDSSVQVGLYSFPEGKVTGVEVKRDEYLEEQNKKIEDFVNRILEGEKAKGTDVHRQVTNADIDKLFYEYNPQSTDVPTVVSKKDFEEITKDGRLVLYRGVLPHSYSSWVSDEQKDDKLSDAKSVSDNFRYGEFYYPVEMQGIYCTKYIEHAKRYATDNGSVVGAVLGFCFTEPDKLKTITTSKVLDITDFYMYFHDDFYLRYKDELTLEQGLKNCFYLMQTSFVARALGYDLIDTEWINPEGLSSSILQVLNRGKLTVCAEDF